MTQLAAIPSVAPRMTAKSGSFFLRLTHLIDLHKQRRALRTLSAEQLRDMGISAQDAAIEAAKPIWDTPTQW